jgi:hypothetical protein
MTKPSSVSFISAIAILFACSAIPAFANHGGVGGGGGSHGGGGFHGGGGGSFHSSGGGGSRGGPAPAGAGYSRGVTSAPSRSYGNSFSGSQRAENFSSARPANGGGQWRSFGSGSGSRGPQAAQSGAGSSANPGSGWHVFSSNRGAGSTGSVRSFSGQGGEVWENAPAARNVVPRSQSLSTLHNSFSGSPAASSGFRSNSTLSASSRLVGGSPFAGHRGFLGGVNSANSFQQLRGGFGFGNRFGRGCWNCGFGFGFGGWGFGWAGLGFWDPFWFDPWWGPGPAYGYGYYGYPNSNVYGDPNSGYYAPDDNSTPPPEQDNQYDQENLNGNWVTPNGPSPALAPNSGNLAVPVLIYMKNGSVLTVRDYWMIDGELHYILMSGVQRTVNLELVDLPRTNTENARSGVKFIFKSEPSITAPAQPDAEPGSPNGPSPAPTQQINAVPQPEART